MAAKKRMILKKDIFGESGKFSPKKLASLRLIIIAIIIMSMVIPLVISGKIILNRYSSKAMEDVVIAVQGQGSLLAADIAATSYLDNVSSEMVDAELEQMMYTYSSRIIVINKDCVIIKDTYDYEVGKTIISKEVLSAFKGSGNADYNVKTGRADITMPIYAIESEDIIGVLNITLADSSVIDMHTYISKIVFALTIVFSMMALLISLIVSNAIVKPLDKLNKSILNVTGGAKGMRIEDRSLYEYNRVAQSVNKMLDRMKVVDDSREEFVANVSHELKTPMASMKVLADSLLGQEEVPNEIYREFMGDIVSEINRENEIISDLLTMVKVDRTNAELNISTVNVNDLVELVLKRLNPIAEERNVELIMESFRPFAAEVDEVKMTLAVNNIVENAIKYNKEEGFVRVSLNADHKYFYIKVADSGIGIPNDCVERVFDRFYRVDKARSRETGGTGLGLAITKSIVLMHKGTIKVYSKENEGTTFTIRIPLYHANAGGDII